MFAIREATPADNEALLRLESESPQGTGIAILIDRDDYFYRSRLHDRAHILIAEEKGKLVGVMAFAIKDVLWDGRTEPVAYFYDLRGEASYRRSMKRGLFLLWRAALEEMEAAGALCVYGHVKADNHDSLSVSTKVGARVAASFDILTLPALRGTADTLDPHLDSLDDEVHRLESFVGPRTMRPVSLADAYVRGAELGYLDGIFRLEEGDSFAQVSAWNLSSIYRGRVLRMPMTLRVLGAVLNPLARVVPVPRIPTIGQQLAYLQLFDPVVQGPRGDRLLRQLVGRIRRYAYQNRLDIVTLFLYSDDPLASRPRFFPQEVLHYYTMLRPLCSKEPPTPPLFLDIRDI